jgi:hypothetical protein
MASNEANRREFTLLGSYLPQDAQKLLDRLDQAGIPFRTRPTMPFPQPGPSTTLLISGLKAQPRHSRFALQRSLLSAKAARGECFARNEDGT